MPSAPSLLSPGPINFRRRRAAVPLAEEKNKTSKRDLTFCLSPWTPPSSWISLAGIDARLKRRAPSCWLARRRGIR